MAEFHIDVDPAHWFVLLLLDNHVATVEFAAIIYTVRRHVVTVERFLSQQEETFSRIWRSVISHLPGPTGNVRRRSMYIKKTSTDLGLISVLKKIKNFIAVVAFAVALS